jgi:hypothetical protein
MFRLFWRSFVLAFFLQSTCQVTSGQDTSDSEDRARHERLILMETLISQIKVYAGPENTKVDRVEKHLMRHDDASRNHEDGTLWAFGKQGRPSVIMILQPDSTLKRRWWYAATSLVEKTVQPAVNDKLQLEAANRVMWAPDQPGISFAPIADATIPADSTTRRLIQMRKIAARFTAHQFWEPDNQRFQLRLLRQPIYRYSSPEKGIIDGAIFGFMINVHPELLLVLETVKQNDNESWQYAFAKIGSAEFHGQLDGKPVFESPRAPGVLGSMTDTFRMFPLLEP